MSDASSAFSLGESISADIMIQYHYLKRTNSKSIAGMTLGDFIEAKKVGKFDENIEDDKLFLRYQ